MNHHMKNLINTCSGNHSGDSCCLRFSKAGKTEKSESGIQFHKGTWSEALALAKKENKLVFLDISCLLVRPL